jgi:hypothetical protein
LFNIVPDTTYPVTGCSTRAIRYAHGHDCLSRDSRGLQFVLRDEIDGRHRLARTSVSSCWDSFVRIKVGAYLES